jgi:hypothetical protein
VDERGRRVGRNEALFREVNERLRELGESFSVVADDAQFVCECGNSTCAQPIAMPLSEYERVRSDPKWFVIIHGHEMLEHEYVVSEHEDWLIVEKRPGGAAGEAIRQDPRS